MATVSYGCISEPVTRLRTMLSYCPAFQLWVEENDDTIPASGDARAAFCLDYIHFPIYDKPDNGYVYPAAVIEVPVDMDFEVIAQSASGGVFNTGAGILNLDLYRPVPTALRNDNTNAWLDFAGVATEGVKTGLGAIIRDLMALPSMVDQFEEFDIGLVDGPSFFKDEKRSRQGHILAAMLRISWGVK